MEVWNSPMSFTIWWWFAKVIRGKEKTSINKLIMIDCAANIFTIMIHTFNQTPLIKLRSTFPAKLKPESVLKFLFHKQAAAIHFTYCPVKWLCSFVQSGMTVCAISTPSSWCHSLPGTQSWKNMNWKFDSVKLKNGVPNAKRLIDIS